MEVVEVGTEVQVNFIPQSKLFCVKFMAVTDSRQAKILPPFDRTISPGQANLKKITSVVSSNRTIHIRTTTIDRTEEDVVSIGEDHSNNTDKIEKSLDRIHLQYHNHSEAEALMRLGFPAGLAEGEEAG